MRALRVLCTGGLGAPRLLRGMAAASGPEVAAEEASAKRQRLDDHQDVQPPPASRFLRASGRRFSGLSCRERGEANRPFHFMQLADTQLGMETCFTGQNGWEKELELMRIAAAEVNRLRPAFAIVCGDLINEFPNEEAGRTANPELRKQQVSDFKKAFSLIDEDIPLVCCCGNHDIGDRPNSVTIRSYTENFGDDYFSFWCNGVKCVVVNSQLWKDDTDAKDEREAMDRWLDAELEEQTIPYRTLIFSHVPPFIGRPDEDNEYFNLESGFRQELLARLVKKGVVAWFCGHFHRNAGGWYRDADGKGLEVVVTAAVGTNITNRPGGNILGKSGIGGHEIGEDVSGLRLVKVFADRVEHEWKSFTQLKAMPTSDAEARSNL